MEENLLTYSDSKLAGKVTVYLESNGKIKTVELRILIFRNLKDYKYYISLIDIGQLAEGESLDDAIETMKAILYNLNLPENAKFKMPKTPSRYITEFNKLTKHKNYKTKAIKFDHKSKFSKSNKPVFELLKV